MAKRKRKKVVKTKYRKLAIQLHPDKQQGKSDKEKQAAEALAKAKEEADKLTSAIDNEIKEVLASVK